jgi:hypothetical protein
VSDHALTGTSAHDRFQAFAEKKIAAAVAANLPPLTTEFDRTRGELEAIGNAWSRRLFDGDFYVSPPSDLTHPACSLVFVQSRDGNTGAQDPSTLGGGQVDKHLIYEGLSQVDADAVLSGSKTIHGEDIVFSVWHPQLVELRTSLGKPRHPTQIIATLGGLDLEEHLLFNVPEIPVLVLTIAAGASRMQPGFDVRPWVTPIIMDGPDDLSTAFEEFRSRGINRVSAVGGRHMAYLTTSPKDGGEPDTPLHPRPPDAIVLVRKHGTGPDTGVIFEHLQMR